MWCYVVLCGAMWCYVVLCGAMWCYVVLCGAMWCYVVLCGAMVVTHVGNEPPPLSIFQREKSPIGGILFLPSHNLP